jgi:hypothetical protein
MGKVYYIQQEVNFPYCVGAADLNSLNSSTGTAGIVVSENQGIRDRKTHTASSQKFGKPAKIHHCAAQPIEDWQSRLRSARRWRSAWAE